MPGADALPEPALTYVVIGKTARLGGPSITSLKVLEDSRCPMNARCVWAGHVRLLIRVGQDEAVEITSGKPIHVADGTLELVNVRPDKIAGVGNGGDNKTLIGSAFSFGRALDHQ